MFSKDDLISVYTRQDAQNDGVLVDLMQGELGDVCMQHYKYPIACTAAVYSHQTLLCFHLFVFLMLCALCSSTLLLVDALASTTHKQVDYQKNKIIAIPTERWKRPSYSTFA